MKFYSLLLALLLTGCNRPAPPDASPYEFHPGAGGMHMWRCNRKTGEVEVAGSDLQWKRVTSQALSK